MYYLPFRQVDKSSMSKPDSQAQIKQKHKVFALHPPCDAHQASVCLHCTEP